MDPVKCILYKKNSMKYIITMISIINRITFFKVMTESHCNNFSSLYLETLFAGRNHHYALSCNLHLKRIKINQNDDNNGYNDWN